MTFSREASLSKVIDIKIRRAKTLAKNKSNEDFNLEHPDWCRDAATNNFTLLEKTIKEKTQKLQKQSQSRRDKLYGNI